MADEQYRWLDRETAERLLRGEPLHAVDADNRDQADRLTEALEALDALGTQTVESTPADAELPGEAAALAAFRKARTGKNGEQATLGPRTRTRSAASATATSSAASRISSDAGLIHLGRPAEHRRVPSRWGRPVRYGLAAALAAGMIGGAAMAATSGVLPFGGEEPEPGSSATVSVSPDRPLVSPSPEKKPGGGPDRPRPDSSAGGPTGKGSAPDGEARGGTDPGARPDPGDDRPEGRPARGWRWLASVCRDLRDGKNLGSERRRGLEDAANGAEQVKKYCQGILKNWDDRDSGDGRSGSGSGRGGSGRGGSGWNNDREDRDGRDNDDDGDEDGDGSHIGAGVSPDAGGHGPAHGPRPGRRPVLGDADADTRTDPAPGTEHTEHTECTEPDAGADADSSARLRCRRPDATRSGPHLGALHAGPVRPGPVHGIQAPLHGIQGVRAAHSAGAPRALAVLLNRCPTWGFPPVPGRRPPSVTFSAALTQ
ncbi:hypothetical protein ACRJ4B_33245 [Streptomyces sp. GTA36]